MRTKLQPMQFASNQELEFIRLMESYGKTEFGIKEETLCKLIFVKELDPFYARELRYYRERYQNFKYIDVIPKGKIIKRGEVYKLITNDNPLKEKMQYNALYNLHCALIDFRNTQRIYGKIQVKGQLNLTELIDTTEVE